MKHTLHILNVAAFNSYRSLLLYRNTTLIQHFIKAEIEMQSRFESFKVV